MRWRSWDRIGLTVEDPASHTGKLQVNAIAPLIVSASRSTDIPAFYGDWFMNRLDAGVVKWRSPFGGQPVYVSFEKTRIFAFWSKNPAPLIPHLDALDRKGYGYFFLITLNDYETERLEPGIPSIEGRIETFIRLSRRVGPGRVIWRFDPLLLSSTITVESLLDRIERIGDHIQPYTRRLIISFIDIARYGRVKHNLAAAGFGDVREFTDPEVTALAEGLRVLNERWGLTISTCGEGRDLTRYGIERGHCIGYEMLVAEFSHDPVMREFLSIPLTHAGAGSQARDLPARYFKDPGQRSTCGCVVSKDIGRYSTCPHGCVYCYANSSVSCAVKNYRSYRKNAASGIFGESII